MLWLLPCAAAHCIVLRPPVAALFVTSKRSGITSAAHDFLEVSKLRRLLRGQHEPRIRPSRRMHHRDRPRLHAAPCCARPRSLQQPLHRCRRADQQHALAARGFNPQPCIQLYPPVLAQQLLPDVRRGLQLGAGSIQGRPAQGAEESS